MKDKIVLNSAEQRRVLVLNQLEAGVQTAAQAGQLLGLAERQVSRLRTRHWGDGASYWRFRGVVQEIVKVNEQICVARPGPALAAAEAKGSLA